LLSFKHTEVRRDAFTLSANKPTRSSFLLSLSDKDPFGLKHSQQQQRRQIVSKISNINSPFMDQETVSDNQRTS
jgi:hypothetical protein